MTLRIDGVGETHESLPQTYLVAGVVTIACCLNPYSDDGPAPKGAAMEKAILERAAMAAMGAAMAIGEFRFKSTLPPREKQRDAPGGQCCRPGGASSISSAPEVIDFAAAVALPSSTRERQAIQAGNQMDHGRAALHRERIRRIRLSRHENRR